MTKLSTRNEAHKGIGSAMLPEGWAQYPSPGEKHLKLNKLFILLQLWNPVSLTTAELTSLLRQLWSLRPWIYNQTKSDIPAWDLTHTLPWKDSVNKDQ